MKILEIITFLGSGGAERFIVDLSNELSKNNDVYLMTLLDDTKDTEVRNFYKFDITSSVKYLNVGLPNGLSIRSQITVLKAINRVNPDVIHFHMIPTIKYSTLACILLSRKYKMYLTIHSDLHNGYDKGFAKILFKTLASSDRLKLVCLSEKNFKDFSSYYPNAEIKCITNGRASINPTVHFETVKTEIKSFRSTADSFLFMHIARFNKEKNQNLLINAFNELCQERKVDLLIIGSGFDSDEGTRLRLKANKDHIHFLGTRKNISDYILNADIFCLSSDYEGMPITLLEASLAGVPAVCTPVCGAVDIIQDGVNGFLSKSHNLEDYKDALKKALDNYDAIKANAMKMKENNPYTIAECARRYVDFFNK